MSVKDYFARHIRLRHMRLLVAIDDAGRLTAAAKALHISQPALSKALTELEKLVGEALFERTPQGLVATRCGAALVRSARQMLAEIDRASQEMQQLESSQSRTLVVGAMPTTPLTFLGKAIAHMTQRDRHITIRVIEAPMPQLLPQLVAGRLDVIVGAQVRSAVPDDVRTTHLYTDLMQIACAKNHPLERARKISWDRLLEFPWVLPPPTNAVCVEFFSALRRLSLPPPTQVLESLSTDMTLSLMQESWALSLLPQRMVKVLQTKDLAKVVGGGHATNLNIQLPVKVFLPEGSGVSADIHELIASIRHVLN